MKNVHQGLFPKLNEQDQSLSEMNDENLHEDSHQDKNETTNDQSGKYTHLHSDVFEYLRLVAIVNNDMDMVGNQWDVVENRLRPRTSGKSSWKDSNRAKIKCDICNKFYRADYMKVSSPESSRS